MHLTPALFHVPTGPPTERNLCRGRSARCVIDSDTEDHDAEKTAEVTKNICDELSKPICYCSSKNVDSCNTRNDDLPAFAEECENQGGTTTIDC
ncbi:hypothetical protein ASPWEDRAFT_186174 [Aspergillus wentii DTO 134E9]|uniref:Uncharacterized protein n=1 Tax=Aspergillus wentii DTO 134E9 TaxID=1073089 RepID=A0A1L9RAI8_ASPWE|nr:uncharacterized protein ASPWEDRAFT_186174 [Aspergillus wentii DTO 134E9]OJJ31934.1 hypothetical protein ASPWEDRAFT_186174 [Aspergillus wentii DTO 134E9]